MQTILSKLPVDFEQQLRSREIRQEPKPWLEWRLDEPTAKRYFWIALSHYCRLEGREPQWLECYRPILSWLQNPNGKGLALLGDCGLGKTLIATRVIPSIIHKLTNRVVTYYHATNLKGAIKETRPYIGVDDVGTEDEVSDYGTKRNYFAELADKLERERKFLIFTSNFRTAEDLGKHYGTRTADRLSALVDFVQLDGTSFR